MLIRSQKTTLLEISSELSPNSRIIYKGMKVADDRIFWEYIPTKSIIGQIFHGEMLIRRQTTSLLQIFSRKLLLLEDKYESSRRCWVKVRRGVIRRWVVTWLADVKAILYRPRYIFKSMRVADDILLWKYLPTKAFFRKIFEGELLIRSQTTTPLQIFSKTWE